MISSVRPCLPLDRLLQRERLLRRPSLPDHPWGLTLALRLPRRCSPALLGLALELLEAAGNGRPLLRGRSGSAFVTLTVRCPPRRVGGLLRRLRLLLLLPIRQRELPCRSLRRADRWELSVDALAETALVRPLVGDYQHWSHPLRLSLTFGSGTPPEALGCHFTPQRP
jgi:hypothetical protein